MPFNAGWSSDLIGAAMMSLWSDAEAAHFKGDLALRAYTSRLLGSDDSLVLHGGGNTSLKRDGVLFVKGTGFDLALVEEHSFTALRLPCAQELLQAERLTNAAMVAALVECLVDCSAPRPSIETLMHAAIPQRYVEHTHADSVLAVINTEHAARIAATVYGELAPLVPYRHSGADLASACRTALEERGTPGTIGLLLQFHGVVAFGDTARASYENMIRLVSFAESYLRANGAWEIARGTGSTSATDPVLPSQFRATFERVAGFAPVVRRIDAPSCSAFLRRPDLPVLSQQGPSTPQHAVYTKRVPLLGWGLDAYAARYTEYLGRTLGPPGLRLIDPAPRIVIDPTAGVLALGADERSAGIAADFYRHDIEVMLRASAHDRYRSAPEEAIARAELEYGAGSHPAREEPKEARATAAAPLPGNRA
jgi:rhamnose utilization protein RhaD (predicted bifunctional aldolase and dehydrogenase)